MAERIRRCKGCNVSVSRNEPRCPYCGTLDPQSAQEAPAVARDVELETHATSAALTDEDYAEAIRHSWIWLLYGYGLQLFVLSAGVATYLIAHFLPETNVLERALFGPLAATVVLRVVWALTWPQRRRFDLLVHAYHHRWACESCGARFVAELRRDGTIECPYCRSDVEHVTAERFRELRWFAEARRRRALSEVRFARWFGFFRGASAPTTFLAIVIGVALFLAGSLSGDSFNIYLTWESQNEVRDCVEEGACVPTAKLPKSGPTGLEFEIVQREDGGEALAVFERTQPSFRVDCYHRVAKAVLARGGQPGWSFPDTGTVEHPLWWSAVKLPPEQVRDWFEGLYAERVRPREVARVELGEDGEDVLAIRYPVVADYFSIEGEREEWRVYLFECSEGVTVAVVP